MKRLSDELIAQYAFGELSDEQVAEVEALLQEDTEAQLVNSAYQGMSLNLRRLQSVPEPQLSADRLRARILQEGLKPKRSAWNLPWTVGPALVGVAAFAFAFLRAGSVSQPPALVSANEIPSVKVALKEPTNGSNSMSSTASSAQVEQIVETPRLVASAPRRKARRASPVVRKDNGSMMVAVKITPEKVATETSDVKPKEEVKSDAGIASMAIGAQPDASIPAAEPLVLIQPETDRGTGANRATEVSATNVTIGG